jgi:hypothetical protein
LNIWWLHKSANVLRDAFSPSVTIQLLAHLHSTYKQESTMAPTSNKKARYAATDKLPESPPPASITPKNIEVSAEEVDEAAVFRDTFLKNLKSKIPDPEKRPLILFLKQRNTNHGKGWLRTALYPGIPSSKQLSDSEMVPFLLLSASLIGAKKSTEIIATATGLSEQTLRNKWGVALSVATTNKIDCSEPSK